MHIETQFREGMGPGLPAAIDQADALLDRGASAQGAAVVGRSAAHDAHRRTQGDRVNGCNFVSF